MRLPQIRHAALLAALVVCMACDRGREPNFQPEDLPPRSAERAGEGRATQTNTPSPKETATPAQAVPTPAPAEQPLVRRPTSPDPTGGRFGLKDALDGLPGRGKLRAEIRTSEGAIECALFDDKAPATVANFVGLARGLRPYWDARTAAWETKPYFDGTTFHRVIPGFMIQGGDHMGSGTGDVGYVFDDELHPSLTHDRAGLLCMANRGRNTNASQFFITDGATPHLTKMKTYTIFGECAPLDVIARIARVPQSGPNNRPVTPVVIESVKITRE
jgi:peptidyl-prolyl cis-trans isomerase A (cyclophilin A)